MLISHLSTVELDIEDNYLSGDLWPIPEMESIERVYAYDNILGGDPTDNPYSFNATRAQGDLATSPIMRTVGLKALDVSTNYYWGTIPTSFGGMRRLQELGLEDLELEGDVPPEIFGLGRLSKLYLGENSLDGTIPAEVGNAKSLGER